MQKSDTGAYRLFIRLFKIRLNSPRLDAPDCTWQKFCAEVLEEVEGVEDPDGGGQHPVQGNNPAPAGAFVTLW